MRGEQRRMTSDCEEIKTGWYVIGRRSKQDEMKLGEDRNRMKSSGRRLKQDKMKLGEDQNKLR